MVKADAPREALYAEMVTIDYHTALAINSLANELIAMGLPKDGDLARTIISRRDQHWEAFRQDAVLYAKEALGVDAPDEKWLPTPANDAG